MDGTRESYRYPGSRPFQDTELDRKLFCGRAREAHTLLHLTLAEKLVVFFAKSGLGKSSLVNAGVLAPLRERNYLPMVVRVNDPEAGPLTTVYKDVEEALHRGGVELCTVPGGRLESHYGLRLDGPPPAKGEIAEHCCRHRIPPWLFFKEVEPWRGDVLLEPVLIFDQFEELFTLQTPERRAVLIDELAHLVRERLPREVVETTGGRPLDDADLRPPALKVILSLREDWLGSLEELTPKIPGILSSRYRLEPLGKEQAREAIERPATLDDADVGTRGFRYEPAAVDAILDFLARRRLHGKMVPTEDVEPSQLQIVCRHLEELVAKPGHPPVVTLDDLGGRPEKVPEVLGGVLEKYYDEQTAKVASWWRRRAVRRLCERGLILDERRASVDRAILQRRYGVSAAELSRLTDAHLLRAVPRLDSVQYELAHDTLVKPILAARDRRRQRFQRVAGSVAIVVSLALALVGFTMWRQAAESREQAAILEKLQESSEDKLEEDPTAFLIRTLAAVDRARHLSSDGTVPAEMKRIYRQAVDRARETDRDDSGTLEPARQAILCPDSVYAVFCDRGGQSLDVFELTEFLAPEDVQAASFARLPDAPSEVRAVVTDALHNMWIRHASGEVQVEPGTPAQLTALAVDPGGRRLATAGADGTLRLWNAEGQPRGRPWRAHARGGVVAAFDAGGRRLASGGGDGVGNGVVKIWNVDGGEPVLVRELTGHGRGVSALAWHPDGETLASGGRDAMVRLWDPEDGDSQELEGHTRPVLALAYDAAGRLASAGADGALRLWDAQGELLRELYDKEGEEGLEVTSVAWSPDGRRLASGGSDKAIRVWRLDGEAEAPTRIADAHDGSVLAVVFHSGDGYLVSGGRDSAVRFWRPRSSSFEEIHRIGDFKRYVNALGLAADGDLLVAASFGGTVKAARGDLADPQVNELRAGYQHYLTAVTFSADGERIASGSTDGTVRLWEWEDGKFRRLTRPIEPLHDDDWGAVEALAFSPGGERIAAGMEDGTLRIWNVRGDPVMEPLYGHAGAVEAVAFEDGDTLKSQGEDGTVRHWDVEEPPPPDGWPDDWLEVPCRRLAEHPLLKDAAAARVRELCGEP